MRRMAPFLVAFSALALPATPSEAADHYDMFEGNPIGGQEPKQHDIVDLFTFPSPDGRGKLVMIMNTNNRAHPSTAFSDAIHYTFRLRAGEQRGQGNEYRITCTFSPIPEDGTNADQKATCIAYKVVAGVATPIQGASTKVGFEQDGGGKNPALKAFVGRRADAFFGDAFVDVDLVTRDADRRRSDGPISQLSPLRHASPWRARRERRIAAATDAACRAEAILPGGTRHVVAISNARNDTSLTFIVRPFPFAANPVPW